MQIKLNYKPMRLVMWGGLTWAVTSLFVVWLSTGSADVGAATAELQTQLAQGSSVSTNNIVGVIGAFTGIHMLGFGLVMLLFIGKPNGSWDKWEKIGVGIAAVGLAVALFAPAWSRSVVGGPGLVIPAVVGLTWPIELVISTLKSSFLTGEGLSFKRGGGGGRENRPSLGGLSGA